MISKSKNYSKEEVLKQILLATRRTALLYHHMSKTLIEELGEDRGKALITSIIKRYGTQIGREAAEKARDKNLALTPENFEGDLPADAWDTEAVYVEGEERIRVHVCPLASEWLEWGDPSTARLYCFVDQAKMEGYNPEYEYVHIKNLLDGDPYCELAVRKTGRHTEGQDLDSTVDEKSSPGVRWAFGRYNRKDLLEMDPVSLRALLRERVHHTIEVKLYPILLGKKKPSPRFGNQVRQILDVWKERGFRDSDPDILWAKTCLEMAQKIMEGKKPRIKAVSSSPLGPEDLEVVRTILKERRSLRNWIPHKPIPEDSIEQILEAGRAAPNSCNLNAVRFIVIRDSAEAKMVWSDVPTPMEECVLIVIGYDNRAYQVVGHDRLVPHNRLLDCAAAADHMCLMAHALGLGAVWLTCTKKTARSFKEKYGLPEHIEPALHIAVGWPALHTLKGARMPLKEMKISRNHSPR